MLRPCPWCGLQYDLTPKTERRHLALCDIFQSLPVAFTSETGQQFVAVPKHPTILCERVRPN